MKVDSTKEEDNILRCPTCGSIKVKKISATSKVIGASMFGLFSKTARSQFKCEQCGYKWWWERRVVKDLSKDESFYYNIIMSKM